MGEWTARPGHTVAFGIAAVVVGTSPRPHWKCSAIYEEHRGHLVVGLGVGIALIAFTENAGKKNEERANQQPCVECKAAQVVQCTICQGSGEDALAQYVAGVREMAGENGESGVSTVTVDDWESGPKKVEMYGDILKAYPPKAITNLCV